MDARSLDMKMLEAILPMQDSSYKAFMLKLLPGVDESRVVGVRNPELKHLVKKLSGRSATKEDLEFARAYVEIDHHDPNLQELNMLHAMLLNSMKFELGELKCLLLNFLPSVDNWAVCDALDPKLFAKRPEGLDMWLLSLLQSEHPYTIRFAIGALMRHYLKEGFQDDYLLAVATLQSDEYYVNMMRAWYMAEALLWQKEKALSIIEQHKMDTWTHKKAIQKYVESRRPTQAEKEYLKSLR